MNVSVSVSGLKLCKGEFEFKERSGKRRRTLKEERHKTEMKRWERSTLFLVHSICYLVQSNFIVFLDERVMDMGIPPL